MDRPIPRFKPRDPLPRLVEALLGMAYAGWADRDVTDQGSDHAPQMPPEPTESRPPSAAAWVATAALCVAAVAGPLCLGGTPPWPRFAIEAAMVTAVVAWAWNGPRARRLALVPLGIAALAMLQIAPLPGGLLMRLAPVSAGRWAVADESMGRFWRTISVDPAATAAGIRRLLLGLATAAVVVDLGRKATCRKWLAGAVGLAAVMVLAAGWLFPVRDRVMLGGLDLKGPIEHWLTPLEPPRMTAGFGYPRVVTVAGHRYVNIDAATPDGFGCYLNSNHFAGALCLTLPVALGAWLWLTRGRLPGAVRYPAVVAAIGLAAWTAGGMAHSRAGAASLLFGGLVFVSLVASHRWLRRCAAASVAVALVGLAGFLLAFLGGFTGLIQILPAGWQPRVAGLMHDPRIAASAAAVRMFRVSPLLGTGLDTYGEMAPPVAANGERLFYAHNDYAQALAETGLVGASIIAAIAALLAIRLRTFLRTEHSAMRPLEAGSWAALAGLAVHSCFDWNLHVPANALLACVNAGLALGSAPNVEPAGTAAKPNGDFWRRGLAIGLGVACITALILLGRDACSERTQRRLRTAIAGARSAILNHSKPVDAAALSAAVEAGERMAVYDPANPRLAVLLGQANLHLAELESPGNGSQPRVDAAKRWFAKARRDAATFVDLCEPVPPKPAAPGPPQRSP